MLRFKQIICLLCLLPTMAFAQTWQAQNTDAQIAVLELFTAESCGLCPAADRWVETFPEQGITPDQLVILGFHIDYLDDKKGWVDRFASPVFTARQSQIARLNLYETIYTPEFVISGEIIHNWKKYVKDVIKTINNLAAEAHIKLDVTEQANQLAVKTTLKVDGDENRQFAVLYLAVTEDGIINKADGGDNAGTTFHHQHLVRTWLGPFKLDPKGETEVTTDIKLNDEWNRHNLKLIAVVQNLNDGFVLQGLSLPLTIKE